MMTVADDYFLRGMFSGAALTVLVFAWLLFFYGKIKGND